MSTRQQTRQQVYISLQKLGFDTEDIEESLIACKSQGLLYNVDWCCYYLAHLKQQSNRNRASSVTRPFSNEKEMNHNTMHRVHSLQQKQHSTLTHRKKHKLKKVYLSDINETIFGDLKCNGFILNGHKNERHQRILSKMNKIYDILFDFLYETQVQHSKNGKNNKKALNKYTMNSIFCQIAVDNSRILCKFGSILNIEKELIAYGRSEFNIMIRLISMYEYGISESLMVLLDYKTSIVKFPHIQIASQFLGYLKRRYPCWSSSTSLSCSLSSDSYDSRVDLSACSFGGSFETSYILSCLFSFYASSCFMAQDVAVSMFVSSSLAQHILEIIWNETAPHNSDNCGLNCSEFVIAAQLIALAQHCLPYNRDYLISILATNTRLPLPSMHISSGFVSYFKLFVAKKKMKNRGLTQLIPYIPESHISNFLVYFAKLDRRRRGFVSGTAIGRFFRKSGLNESILAQVWDLSDIDNDGKLSSSEFCVAMHLINCVRQGAPLPNVLPHSLIGERREYPVFSAHLNLSDLCKLRQSSFVDYRGDDGKYICAQIIDIDCTESSKLLLRSIRNSRNRFWCDFHTEMYRIAAASSITLRPITRREMLSYRIGDRIDINPYHTDCARGWKLGYIIDFDVGQALVSVANMNMLYWVHLDNPMEASPPHEHSEIQEEIKEEESGFVMLNYPNVSFGGTQTDAEVQYVLKTLNKSKKRHTLPINTIPIMNKCHSLNKEAYYKERCHSLNNNKYSATAPNTPIKVSENRFKYHKRRSKSKLTKSKSKSKKKHHHHHHHHHHKNKRRHKRRHKTDIV